MTTKIQKRRAASLKAWRTRRRMKDQNEEDYQRWRAARLEEHKRDEWLKDALPNPWLELIKK